MATCTARCGRRDGPSGMVRRLGRRCPGGKAALPFPGRCGLHVERRPGAAWWRCRRYIRARSIQSAPRTPALRRSRAGRDGHTCRSAPGLRAQRAGSTVRRCGLQRSRQREVMPGGLARASVCCRFEDLIFDKKYVKSSTPCSGISKCGTQLGLGTWTIRPSPLGACSRREPTGPAPSPQILPDPRIAG